MNAGWQLELALWVALWVTACSTTPPARVATDPPASEPATAAPTVPPVPTPPAWLAHFTLTSEIATAVHAALASREPMTGREAVEWITRVAAALAQVPTEHREEAEAQAWALTGLLIEEMAFTARACREQRTAVMSDIESMAQSMARLLGEQRCPAFPEIVSDLYRSCSESSFPNIAQFCQERLQRWERPACEPYAVPEAAPNTDVSIRTGVLHITLVETLLHTDEVDAIGEALARTLSRRTRRPVRYQSDSGFDYGPQCNAAYRKPPPDGDWFASLQGGAIEVTSPHEPDEAWVAEASARHRPSAWLRAARAMRAPNVAELFPMGGLGMAGVGRYTVDTPVLTVVDSHLLPRNVDPTWEAITAAHERCNSWGTHEWVVSVSDRGELVRATLRTAWGTPFDVAGIRCLTRELDALSRPGRVAGRAVIELAPAPESAPASGAFPLDNSPRVDACVGNTRVDLCLDVTPDGRVARWNAALAWETIPRALADVTATPVTPAISQCFAGIFERGVACTPSGDQVVLELPSRP